MQANRNGSLPDRPSCSGDSYCHRAESAIRHPSVAPQTRYDATRAMGQWQNSHNREIRDTEAARTIRHPATSISANRRWAQRCRVAVVPFKSSKLCSKPLKRVGSRLSSPIVTLHCLERLPHESRCLEQVGVTPWLFRRCTDEMRESTKCWYSAPNNNESDLPKRCPR